MTDPDTYIQSRVDAVRRYFYETRLTYKCVEDASEATIVNMLKPHTRIKVRTADIVYQNVKRRARYYLPVEGEQYEEWHGKIFKYISDFQDRNGMGTMEISGITGIHGSRYINAKRGNTLLNGRLLYEGYVNLRQYMKVANHK